MQQRTLRRWWPGWPERMHGARTRLAATDSFGLSPRFYRDCRLPGSCSGFRRWGGCGWRRGRTLRSCRSRRWLGRWGVRIHLGDQFDVEDQVGFGWNRSPPSGAVSELPRNEKPALAADVHSVEAFVPAGNHAVRALNEVDRRAAVDGGVEFGAVMQPSGVMDLVLPAGLGQVAGADFVVDVFQGELGLRNPLNTGMFGGSFIAVEAAVVPAAGLCVAGFGAVDVVVDPVWA